MKRRALVIPLAGIMLAALAMPALAEGGTLTNTADPQKIQVFGGSVTDGDASGTVYSVDIEWGSMIFEYAYTNSKTWNPETHTYSSGTTPIGWRPSGDKNDTGLNSNEIKVTNHSNIDVTCSFLFQPEPWLANEFEPSSTFSPAEIKLDTGETRKREDADNKTTSLKITSKPIEKDRPQQLMGTISVTIK